MLKKFFYGAFALIAALLGVHTVMGAQASPTPVFIRRAMDAPTTTPSNNDTLLWNSTLKRFTFGAGGGGGGSTASGTTSSIQFNAGGTTLGANSLFVWDNTNNRLGVGTTTPLTTVDITGTTTLRSGQFIAPNGTGSAPTFAFSGNTMSGLYLASDGYPGISSNNIRGLWVDYNGWVYVQQLRAPASTQLLIHGQVANGATAVGTIINNVTSLSTAGAKLISVTNASVEKLYIDKDGNIYNDNLLSDFIIGSTVGSIIIDPVTSTYINGLQVGNLNWPTDGGEVGSLNMDLSALASGLYASESLLGLNSTYYFKMSAPSLGSGTYDSTKTRVGFFPDLSWGGLNQMGGVTWHATTTLSTSATAVTVPFIVAASGTMAFDCDVVAYDTATASSSYYSEKFLIARAGTGNARQVGATTEVAIEDVAAWGAAVSSTATGLDLNLTGAATTNIDWKVACKMVKIEI